jgi:serine/threonine protein kinase
MSDPLQLGRYRLSRQIASGGMAEIWLAKQDGPAGFQKDVVVKRILPHLASDEKFVEMFLDEARLAARLDHPNIVQIFDLGQADTSYFIAMEFVDGWDLEAIIDRAVALRRPLHPAICARIMADACTGLDYAHTFKDQDGHPSGLVHRDISPQNIRVSRSGLVKVMDFGIAKARSSSNKTQTGAVKGKLSYMSPEQIMAQELDARSDIFALGIVLYEMLAGQRPFGHDSELLAINAIMNQSPRSLGELIPNLPGELEQIVLCSLAKDREQRFRSAAELQSVLEQYLRAEGVLLTPRDVSEYLADLFSDNPTGRIAALERSNYGSTSTSPNGGLPGSKISSGPTRVNHAGGISTITHVGIPDPDDGRRKRSGAGVVLLILAMLGVVAVAGAALVWFVVLPGMNAGTPPDSAALAADAEGSSAAQAAALAAEASAQAAVLDASAMDAVAELVEIDALPSPDAALVEEGSGSQAVADGSGSVPADGSGAQANAGEDSQDAGTGAEQTADVGTAAVEQPERPRPRPQPANTGSVRVILSESATIYLGGTRRGSFGAGSHNIPNVPAGSHTLRAVSSAGIERSQSVDVRNRQTLTVRVQF